MIIRKYSQKDRESVIDIHFQTGFLGKPMASLITKKELFAKEINYYLDKESQSIFVVEQNGGVVGYLLGCLDDKRHNESVFRYAGKVLMNIFRLPFLPSKDRKYWGGQVKIIFYALFGRCEELKFKTPKKAGHIHINLLPEARGKGVGSKLLEEFFIYAKKQGVKVIHADSFETKLNPNKNFWLKNGFKEYSKVKTSFWHSVLPKEDIYLVCYVKEL